MDLISVSKTHVRGGDNITILAKNPHLFPKLKNGNNEGPLILINAH